MSTSFWWHRHHRILFNPLIQPIQVEPQAPPQLHKGYPALGDHGVDRMGRQPRVVCSSANINEAASDGLIWLHFKAVSIVKRLRVIRSPSPYSTFVIWHHSLSLSCVTDLLARPKAFSFRRFSGSEIHTKKLHNGPPQRCRKGFRNQPPSFLARYASHWCFACNNSQRAMRSELLYHTRRWG